MLLYRGMRWLRRGRGTNNSGNGGGGVDPSPAIGPTSFRFLLLVALFASLFTCAASANDANVDTPSFDEPAQHTDTPRDEHADDVPVEAVPLGNPLTRESSAASALISLFSDDGDDAEDALGDDPECTDSSAATIPNHCTVEDQRLVVLHNHAEDLTHIRDVPFASMFRPDSRCLCNSTTPNHDCVAYFFLFPMDEVCVELNLDPAEPLTNRTLGQPLDIVYPWFTEDDGGKEHDMESYGDEDEHVALHGMMSWITHCRASVRIPLHRHGPFEFDIVGTPLHEPENDLHSNDIMGHPPLQPPDADFPNRKDSDVNVMEDNPDEDTPYQNPKHAGPDPDYCLQDDSSGTDDYEEEYHNCVYGYLCFGVYPFTMRGNSTAHAKSRKVWGQNARRRYQIRVHGEDNISRYSVARVFLSFWICLSIHFVMCCV